MKHKVAFNKKKEVIAPKMKKALVSLIKTEENKAVETKFYIYNFQDVLAHTATRDYYWNYFNVLQNFVPGTGRANRLSNQIFWKGLDIRLNIKTDCAYGAFTRPVVFEAYLISMPYQTTPFSYSQFVIAPDSNNGASFANTAARQLLATASNDGAVRVLGTYKHTFEPQVATTDQVKDYHKYVKMNKKMTFYPAAVAGVNYSTSGRDTYIFYRAYASGVGTSVLTIAELDCTVKTSFTDQ